MLTKRSILFSVALHVGVVALLTFSVDFGPAELQLAAPHKEVVKAVVVDRRAVENELERLRAEDEKTRLEEEQRAREAERQAQAAEKKRKQEERRLAELKAEKDRLKKQQDAETKRLAEEKRKAKDEARVAADERRLAEQRKQEQERRLAERKRKEEEKRQRIEDALHDELAAEEQAIAAARAAAEDDAEISRYVVAIRNRVRQSFTILPGLDGLTCTLRIMLIPGGEVSQVEVMQSSGNATFDRQAENAVRKAAPLPVPANPRLFQQLRSISFVFDPES